MLRVTFATKTPFAIGITEAESVVIYYASVNLRTEIVWVATEIAS